MGFKSGLAVPWVTRPAGNPRMEREYTREYLKGWGYS